jgi:hypothetical protein
MYPKNFWLKGGEKIRQRRILRCIEYANKSDNMFNLINGRVRMPTNKVCNALGRKRVACI